MRKRLAVAGLALATAVATVAVAGVGAPAQARAAGSLTNVLVFSKTAGFRHDSIGTGVDLIRQLGRTNGVKVNDYASNRAIASGYIGVQNDGAGLDINYRDIRVRVDAEQATDLVRGRPVTASSVELQTSDDAWTTVYGTTTGDGGVDDVAVDASGRYVRVFGTQRATQWGYSLWELNVLGS